MEASNTTTNTNAALTDLQQLTANSMSLDIALKLEAAAARVTADGAVQGVQWRSTTGEGYVASEPVFPDEPIDCLAHFQGEAYEALCRRKGDVEIQGDRVKCLRHPECEDKLFSRDHDVFRHLKREDYGVRWVCPYCSEKIGWSQASHVKAHMHKSHARPTYTCTTNGCGHKCHDWSQFIKHMDRRHGGANIRKKCKRAGTVVSGRVSKKRRAHTVQQTQPAQLAQAILTPPPTLPQAPETEFPISVSYKDPPHDPTIIEQVVSTDVDPLVDTSSSGDHIWNPKPLEACSDAELRYHRDLDEAWDMEQRLWAAMTTIEDFPTGQEIDAVMTDGASG